MPNRQTIWLSSSMTFTWTNSNFTSHIYTRIFTKLQLIMLFEWLFRLLSYAFFIGLDTHVEQWMDGERCPDKSQECGEGREKKKGKVKTNIIIWWHAWLHTGTQLEQVSYFTIWCKGQLRGVQYSITIIIFKKNWALGAHALLHHHMSYMWAWPCSFTKPSSPYKYTHWFELQLHLCFFSCMLAIVIIYLKSASTSLLFLISSPGSNC